MGRDKKYPIQQEVVCAVCGEPGVRTVRKCMELNNLWYCSDEHRAARRKMVLEGKLPPSPVWEKRKGIERAKRVAEVQDIETDKVPKKPRKSPEDIVMPTDYEKKLWGR